MDKKTLQRQTTKSKRDDKNTIRQDRESQNLILNVGEKQKEKAGKGSTLFYPHYITK